MSKKHALKPCKELSESHGLAGIEARKSYLGDRNLNDQKINDMVSLVYKDLYTALKTAMDRLKGRPDGAGEWANNWHLIYPCMAIVENR